MLFCCCRVGHLCFLQGNELIASQLELKFRTDMLLPFYLLLLKFHVSFLSQGNELIDSQLEVKFRTDVPKRDICRMTLDDEDVRCAALRCACAVLRCLCCAAACCAAVPKATHRCCCRLRRLLPDLLHCNQVAGAMSACCCSACFLLLVLPPAAPNLPCACLSAGGGL